MTERCPKCDHDFSTREFRTCCGLLQHTCARCRHQWTAYAFDDARNVPLAHDVAPESLRTALEAV